MFQLKLRIMGFSAISFDLSFLFILPRWCIINFPISVLIDFSLVARLIIVQVLISSKIIDIEVVHSPMWAIRVAVLLNDLLLVFV